MRICAQRTELCSSGETGAILRERTHTCDAKSLEYLDNRY
jgi:hypothetical protein